MATAFGSVGAESNGWARGLCPIGLVSTSGKSGVKVTAASTVRGSALFIETFYIQLAQRYTIKHWTLRVSVDPFVVLSPGKKSSTGALRVLGDGNAITHWCLVIGRHWNSMPYCVSRSAHR